MKNGEESNTKEGKAQLQKKTKKCSMKFIMVISALIMSAGLLFSSGYGVQAAGKKPTGGLAEKPKLESLGIDEVESGVTVIDEELIPESLDTILDTGEHYKYLSGSQKILYQALYKAITSGSYVPYSNPGFSLPKKNYTADANFKEFAYVYNVGAQAYSYSNDDVNVVSQALIFDHPDKVEYYMCYPMVDPGSYIQDGQYYNWIIVKSYYDESQFATMDNQITASLSQLVSEYKTKGYNSSSFDAVTEYNIYGAYSSSITYDDSAMYDDNVFNPAHTAWAALYKKSAVCDGYSCGFQLLMESFGIESRVVTGVAGNPGDEGGHAWNMVKLDGSWYDTDTTWYTATYDYFNKTTEAFKADHRRDSGYFGSLLNIATGTYWTYDYITKNYNAWINDARTAVSAISVSPATCTLEFDHSIALDISFTPSNASNTKYTVVSSNPDVAYVSGDAVTGMSPGTATITVTSEDGGHTATCAVTVVASVGTYVEDASGNLYQIIGDNEVAFSYASESAGSVNIPSSVNLGKASFNVTKISNKAFKGNTNIKKVTGGANIKSIGKSAFQGCTKLKNVNITSANLKTIGNKAFYNCKKLSKVTLNGEKLSTVKSNAFSKANSGIKFIIKAKKSKYKKIVKKIEKAGATSATFKKK